MNLRIHCPAIYGPVQSRRHGLSLGINLGDPHAKVCTWGCIYCQCGFGSRKESKERNDGEKIPSLQQVLGELKSALQKHPNLDSVTMAGNSEPTAHPEFSQIVHSVLELRKETGGRWIFNCLSNGSELDQDSVVNACDRLDEAWVKLDCGIDELFRKLNRPTPSVGTVDSHIERIQRLSQPMLQSLFWNCSATPEVANWTEANRQALLAAYLKIAPQQIFITTVEREPAFQGAEPVSKEELETFAAEIRNRGLRVKVFAR